ncbi:response regulator receiver modulated diguanylate cyclase [Thalassoporum mexicanum PCC 7367]|uniref:diguanylate cyclase domain-containing protein n=1 Tax=Thalassoporum mexicanum TaxID=3457544 RepID=UPI00029FD489|nr:diguanylate cyclase [Pseudanabaena sp. PCC 7367]AFY71021.1 response regulator receiver modulated diguanylate cyclase [Pseudanabaena sp. PCC 7367]
MDDFLLKAKIPRVLIVDDERIIRSVLNRVLAQDGYQISEAEDGQQCLDFCEKELPDIILLDAQMPILDGFDCCQQLHQIYRQDCPPVLMVTALDDEKSIDMAFEVGAIDYVTKPIKWAVLRQRVRRLIQTGWAIKELRQLAFVDSLTQLPNRRRFDEYIHHEWQRLLTEHAPLSLILSDIDFFKAYNDSYGHLAGDGCLRQVATLIQSSLKDRSTLATRYGGEEFAIVLPNVSIVDAKSIATKIMASVHASQIEHKFSSIQPYITLSFGVACTVPIQQQSVEQLIETADRALYEAKQKGRNRIACIALSCQIDDMAELTEGLWQELA